MLIKTLPLTSNEPVLLLGRLGVDAQQQPVLRDRTGSLRLIVSAADPLREADLTAQRRVVVHGQLEWRHFEQQLDLISSQPVTTAHGVLDAFPCPAESGERERLERLIALLDRLESAA